MKKFKLKKNISKKNTSEKDIENVWCHKKSRIKDLGGWSFGANAWMEPLKEEILEYNHKKIIAFKQYYEPAGDISKGSSYWIVPGYIVGEPEHYDLESKIHISSETGRSLIDRIISKKEREEIKEMIGEDITFW